MQRTSSQFVRCVYRQPFVQLLFTFRGHVPPNATCPSCYRNLATRGSKKTPTSSTTTSTTTTTPTATSATSGVSGASATATATVAGSVTSTGPRGTQPMQVTTSQPSSRPTFKQTQFTPQIGTTFRNPSNAPRPIMREENMWQVSNHSDTKWLHPRDPHRYRPDFAQTEPTSLRNQFTRSPDERTRDAQNHDWEKALRMAKNMRHQFELRARQNKQGKLPIGGEGEDPKPVKKSRKRGDPEDRETKD